MDIELLEPKQAAFFDKYVNKKYRGKKEKAIQQQLKSELDRHETRKRQAMTLIGDLPMLPSNSPFYEERKALFVRYQELNDDIKTGKTSNLWKGLSNALKAITQANAQCDALIKDAKAFEAKAFKAPEDDGGDPGEAIKRLKQVASMKQRDYLIQFSDASAETLQKLAAASGEAPSTPPVVAAFDKAFTAFLTQIRAVPEAGITAKAAQTQLDAIVSAMGTAYANHEAKLNAFATSDQLEQMIANGQLKGRAYGALDSIRDAATQLQNWGLPTAAGFATKADAIEDKLGPLFDADTSSDATKAKAIAEGRQKLTDLAEKTQTEAEAAVTAHEKAFHEPQQRLRIALNKEKARFNGLDPKAFEKGQKDPADSLLAMTETAINGLGGCNIAALEPASKLIFEFSKLVDELESLSETNATIKALMKEIASTIKSHSGSKNILFEVFGEHQTSYDTLASEWAGKTPSDALKAVNELKATVDADVTRQTDLIARRAGIATRIKETRTHFKELTTALNALQKDNGMDKGDYRGKFVDDLNTCENWNATKLDLAFYTTIDARIDRVNKGIGDTLKGLELTAGLSDTEVLGKAELAQKQFEDAVAAMGQPIDATALKNAKDALNAQLDMLGVRAGMVSEDKRVGKAIEDAKQAKADYLEDSKSWLAEIAKEAKSGQHAKVLTDYADDVKTNTDRISSSRDAVKKGSSVPAAISELAFVKKHVEAIKNRGEQSKKDKLDLIGSQWKSSRDAFFANCYKLLDEVDAFEKSTGSTKDAKDKLDKALGAIISKLNGGAFDPAARIFANEDADARDRLAAREMALSEVRRINDLILNDPVIRKCTRNPFDVKAFADPVARRLRQIELEVLRGVSRT